MEEDTYMDALAIRRAKVKNSVWRYKRKAIEGPITPQMLTEKIPSAKPKEKRERTY